MKKKRVYQSIMWCVAVILFLVPALSTKATENETRNMSTVTTDAYHIMLLVDKSGSMNATDRDGLAKSAACQFVDQLCTTYSDLAIEAQVGAMSFSRSAELISDSGLIQLDTAANTSLLKSQINGIQYDAPNTGGTDLGTAIYEAVQELQKHVSENCKNMIVMFTDGYSENPQNRQVSEENLDTAFTIAKELDCEIYIVGLNYGDNIKSEGKKEIYYIADTAQKKEGVIAAAADDADAQFNEVNYMITDNINDVREFYGRIYAKMIGSELEFIDNHRFYVTSESVVEADVTIYSETAITGIRVEGPDGKEQQEDGSTFFVSGDSYYKVIRIIDPKMGEWFVSAFTKDDGYQSFVVQFHGIELAIQAAWGERGEFPELEFDAPYAGQVIVTPMYKGETYKGQGLEEDITTAQFIVSTNENNKENYSLSYNGETGKFTGYFPVETGNYHLSAELSGDSIHRVVECDLEVNIPDTPGSESSKDITVPEDKDMNKSITDNGDGFKWSYVLIIFILMLVLGIVIGLWIKRKRTFVRGSFDIVAEDLSRDYKRGNNIYKYPHGKRFSVWHLFGQIVSEIQTNGEPSQDDQALLELLEKEKHIIAKSKIEIRERHDGRKVYKLNKGKALRELNREIVCYKTDQLRLTILFEPELENPKDISGRSSKRLKKRGRVSSRQEIKE